MVTSPQVSWLFFKAVRAGLAVKRPYLSHTGRASNAEKQPTGSGPKGCDENGPAAALLVGHVSVQICSLLAPCRRPILIATIYLLFRGQDTRSGVRSRNRGAKAGAFAYSGERTSPVFDSNIETQRVESKFDNTITRITVNGTHRNAPTIPQSEPQIIKAMITVNGLRLSDSPMTFGSTTFPIS